MPLYEYYCKQCDTSFERLRPASEYDEAARCANGHRSSRQVVSLFATVSTMSRPMPFQATGGGCACGGGGCACGH